MERIKALEAERDAARAAVEMWQREASGYLAERDALQRNCTALVQMFELAASIPSMSDEQLSQLVANGKAAIDAAKGTP